eukprot:3822029-Rhodomonas_salina.1
MRQNRVEKGTRRLAITASASKSQCLPWRCLLNPVQVGPQIRNQLHVPIVDRSDFRFKLGPTKTLSSNRAWKTIPQAAHVGPVQATPVEWVQRVRGCDTEETLLRIHGAVHQQIARATLEQHWGAVREREFLP